MAAGKISLSRGTDASVQAAPASAIGPATPPGREFPAVFQRGEVEFLFEQPRKVKFAADAAEFGHDADRMGRPGQQRRRELKAAADQELPGRKPGDGLEQSPEAG